jgi:hypothetical protein
MAPRIFFLPAMVVLLLVVVLLSGPAQTQELEWAKSAGGSGQDFGRGVAVDPRGNSYVTGSFSGTATFGAGEVNEVQLTDIRPSSFFVAKFNSYGTLSWAKSEVGYVLGSDIASDPRGNIYVSGSFIGTVNFGAGGVNRTVIRATDSTGFIAKYSPYGTLSWVASIADPYSLGVIGISVDPRGNSYVIGRRSNNDVIVAKYTPDVALSWIKTAGGSGSAPGGDHIAVDARGNSYVTGSFSETVTFGAGELNEVKLTAVGLSNVFVAKYAPDGTLSWAKSAGGSRFDRGTGIATDPRGNSYVTGALSSHPAIFGADESNEIEIGRGIFLAKYSPNGMLLWAKSDGDVPSDPDEDLFGYSGVDGSRIAVDVRGNSYITGMLYSRIGVFGAREEHETAVGGGILVAKYGQNGKFQWIVTAGRPDMQEARVFLLMCEAIFI